MSDDTIKEPYGYLIMSAPTLLFGALSIGLFLFHDQVTAFKPDSLLAGAFLAGMTAAISMIFPLLHWHHNEIDKRAREFQERYR